MKIKIPLCAAFAIIIITTITACSFSLPNAASEKPQKTEPSFMVTESSVPEVATETEGPVETTAEETTSSFRWSGNGNINPQATKPTEEETTGRKLQFSAIDAKKDDQEEDIVEDYIEDGNDGYENRTDFVSVYDQFSIHYWDFGEVAINGNLIDITDGITFDTLSREWGLMWTDETDENDTLDPGYYCPRAVVNSSGQAVIVYLINLSDNTLSFRDSMVLGIGTVAGNEFMTFELSNGINSNSTYDDVVKFMGEPDETTEVGGVTVIRYISDTLAGVGPVAQFALSKDGHISLFTYTLVDLS